MAHLFSPLTVKSHTLSNRIVLPPMANSMSGDDGAVTDAHIKHYVRRASAGVGMVIVEHAYVRPDGRYDSRHLGIHADALVPGLTRLAEAIKACGTVVGIQITHGGGKVKREVIGGQSVAPSDGKLPCLGTDAARALTLADLDALEACYVAVARRALQAGFDFIEVHGAHGYLLSEFLSPLANRRNDAYGGSLENRLRFPLRIVKAVRQVVGDAYLLLYRLGGCDYTPGGLTEEEGQQAAQALVAAGIDLLDVSGGLCEATLPGWDGQSQGYFVPLAAGIKAAVSVPVIATGGITDPVYADQIIRSGQVDLVGIGRAMLKNPDWASQARAALA
jgi:2,4-dienoyl-CoA reductase-like NADH-dependent reductase (Old Yellow Enzyme family)